MVTDLLADLLFATSPEALDHLAARASTADRVHFVGNVMIDTLLEHRDRVDDPSAARAARARPARSAS